MFYWRSTFSDIREHLRVKYQKDDFDQAYEAFQHQRFSPQNLLYQYGLAFQSSMYRRLQAGNDQKHVPKPLGINKGSDDVRLVATCCLTYRLSKTICPEQNVLHEETINGIDYDAGYGYLECLREEVSSSIVDAMMGRCLVQVTSGTWEPQYGKLGDKDGNIRNKPLPTPPPPPPPKFPPVAQAPLRPIVVRKGPPVTPKFLTRKPKKNPVFIRYSFHALQGFLIVLCLSLLLCCYCKSKGLC
mmetsp:Transcript_96508/g.176559  ORF Transcript_96508/g.176559 Transcript_96508/m.176559 type:complete len:243 (+) Transcript_96508:3-731(+)